MICRAMRAKWNIYSVALQDLTFFTFSYLKVNLNYQNIDQAKEIFNKILDDEISNKMPLEIIEDAKKNFDERFKNINWVTFHLTQVLYLYINGHL